MEKSDAHGVVTALAFVLVAGWWACGAWLSREVRPWAIEWTGPFLAFGLVTTYACVWLLAVERAAERQRMLLRAIAVTGTGCVCLLILETAALVGLVDYKALRIDLLDRTHGTTRMFVEDRELSFKRPANASWSGRPRSDLASSWDLPIWARRTQTFTTDSRGFRNPCDRSRADVVLIGDSYVEGNHVSDEETVAAALERFSDRPVVNLAVAGYGTLQELVVLERHALPLAPRLVAWFFFEGNDLYDDQNHENAQLAFQSPPPETAAAPSGAPKRRFSWRSGKQLADASFSKNALSLLRLLAHPLFPRTVEYFGWVRDENGRERAMYFWDYATLTFGDYERNRFEKTKAAFRRGAALLSARGIRLVLFYVPMKFRVYGDLCRFPRGSPCLQWRPWDLASRFQAFCAEAGLACVDLTPAMRDAARAGKLLYFAEDSHWSESGHEFVASELLKAWEAPPPDA